MRDVGHEDRPDLFGDLGEPIELDDPRHRGAAAEDELGPLLPRQPANLVEVDGARLARDAVLDRAQPLPGDRHRPAVRQVAAHRQRHAHHRVARLAEGQVHGEVGDGAGVGLDVRVVDAEEPLRPLDRERFDRVDHLLPLVVATARVALGVLVR